MTANATEKIYKPQKYERIGTLSIDEVFFHIQSSLEEKRTIRVNIQNYFVKINSLRLLTFFHTGVNCPCCDNTASFFAVERMSGSQDHYHLNLYGLNEKGEEILFTHDHIVARSLGGKDNLTNTETMCGPCNWKKGQIEQKLGYTKSDDERAILFEQLKKYEHNNKRKRIKL